MPLNYLDTGKMTSVISETWKKYKNTKQDPANHRWFATNPDGTRGGLYGDLDDEVDTVVKFDKAGQSLKNEVITCMVHDTDNRNGKTPKATVSLTYTHSKTQSQTHTTSHQIHVGTGVEVKAKFVFEENTFKFDFNYEYKLENATSKMETETITFKSEVPVTVPKGKVYRTILAATKNTATVPTRTYINLRGTSNAWFENRVDGHYNWKLPAAELCKRVAEYHSAGGDSSYYKSFGDHGAIELHGQITGVQVVNFKAYTRDVTPKPKARAAGAHLAGEAEALEEEEGELHLAAEPEILPDNFLSDPSIVSVHDL